jgi:hypothetical protein
VIAQCEHGAPLATGMLVRFDNARVHEPSVALSYAARLGYALGEHEALPAPGRPAGRAPPAPAEEPPVEEPPAADASARDADRISAWLREHAPADAPPTEAIARLLADHEALECLHPNPA